MAKAATVAGLPPEKALALGERMYREGILPNGKPMESVVGRDIKVAGISFGCASCHLRSGVGSVEGGVVTLPITGFKLAQARYWKYQNLLPEERKQLRVQTPAARPPYTDETLARVLRTGIDASGRELKTSMPRYNLKADDMAILVHYLWALSATPSPGAEGDTIRFATIITDGVSNGDQQAMLVPMNNYVARHNTHASGMGNRMYMSIGGKEMAGSYRKLSLSVWRLEGGPETWGRQLEAYQAKEPVFALLGGITHGEWKPIHAFCEAQKLPCLFPITELPVVSETDWYTQYFSKGYYQEGQAAARYLSNLEDKGPAASILQIVQDGPEGRDLARGFLETWRELGQGDVKEIRLKPGETLDATALQPLLQQEKPTSLLLWTGAGAFGAVESLADQAGRPGLVFMSSRLLGPQLLALPGKARPFTYITYPYREPRDEPSVSRYANSLLAGLPVHQPESRISTRTYSMLQLFTAALVEMDRNLYRDNLLDRIGLFRDYVLPDYLRLSFGPGQRYASKGCFIMQLGPGPEPKLIRKSEWVIH
ncbi:MAG: ABC transporter substrate-binding protein [Holophagaceae bacterium]|uniref:ABC transporter substrate-binding protein n=1 Tax=Candidatus Geothrix skivensis TaxID=2954439 RepID=A0A9D7SDV1_9BACT|nr:ABC transporter substrate-binding protein [Candidatus Geothrix skivensis]